MGKPEFCDYSDEYFVWKRKISATDTNNAHRRRNKKLIFNKNNSPFRCYISKISNTSTMQKILTLLGGCIIY